MQMIIYHSEPRRRNGKVPGEQLQPTRDPLFAMLEPLARHGDALRRTRCHHAPVLVVKRERLIDMVI